MIAGVVLADRAAETVAAALVKHVPAAVDGALLDNVPVVGLGEGGGNAENRNAESGNTGTEEERDAMFRSPKRKRGEHAFPNPKRQRGAVCHCSLSSGSGSLVQRPTPCHC